MRLPVLAVMVMMAGCVAPRGTRFDAVRLMEMQTSATQLGLSLDDPLQLTPQMREAAVRLGRHGTELERAKRLNLWLRSSEGLGFTYDAKHTRTATAAFDARSGDCLSFAFLFVAMARHMGVPMNFVRYREARTFDERNGQFTMVSHVAALFTDYKSNVLVELSGEPPSVRVSDYAPIGDDEAAGLLMSNLAMERFTTGDRELPLKTMQFLVEKVPGLPEVHANLAAVLLRQGRASAAMPVVTAGLERFPDYVPLYVNGSVAARGVGNEQLSAEYAEKARSAFTDPFMPFVKGVWLYEKKHYAAAEQLIRRARTLQPQSALFAAWLARVQLKAGQYDDAVKSLDAATALNPQHPLIREIRANELDQLKPGGGASGLVITRR